MTDKTICRNDGRCEYAIQSCAEVEGHCPNGKCAMPASAPGTGSDVLDCILGVGGFASFGPLDAQPAAHLTIPGALEWDGDNGTHGADGESRAHGEQEISDDDLLKMADKAFGQVVDYDLLGNPITDYRILTIGAYGPAIRRLVSLARQHPVAPASAYTAVDMTTAAAGGFRDGQAELYAVLNQAYMALIGYLPGHRNDLTDSAIAACSAILFPVEAKPSCESCGGWGHIETEDSAHDCPECGPSLVERAVEAGVMNAPKPYVAMSEAEADEFLSSFGGGSGNKAKRRIAALAAKAKPESFPCWSCRKPVTLEGRAAEDGFCPHCTVELDLEGGDDE